MYKLCFSSLRQKQIILLCLFLSSFLQLCAILGNHDCPRSRGRRFELVLQMLYWQRCAYSFCHLFLSQISNYFFTLVPASCRRSEQKGLDVALQLHLERGLINQACVETSDFCSGSNWSLTPKVQIGQHCFYLCARNRILSISPLSV